MYVWYIYGIFGRDFSKYTIIYGAYIRRVGQNHIYTVHLRYSWQGNHQIHGHTGCIYTVLADPYTWNVSEVRE